MIENHVTSLETAKRLKELGVKQESEFYWEENELYPKSINLREGITFPDEKVCKYYSAFLASEIPLPYPYCITKRAIGYDFMDINNGRSARILISDVDNLSEAHGLSWIYLIENNILKVGDLQWER